MSFLVRQKEVANVLIIDEHMIQENDHIPHAVRHSDRHQDHDHDHDDAHLL
jgi:hypothetical protein